MFTEGGKTKMRKNNSHIPYPYLLAGSAIGAAAGLLLAPYSGRKTRRLIVRRGRESRDFVEDTGRDLYKKGVNAFEHSRDWSKQAADRVERRLRTFAA
jgi:gas vesicle protein